VSPRIAVVGGGITGLAAAHTLAQAREAPDVLLLESSDRLGGKLRTEPLAGLAVEAGADAFITREPDALRLARDVGLGEDLVGPSVSGVQLWLDGRLHELPEGVVLGVPTRLAPLLRSGAVPAGAALRAGLDLVMPRRTDLDTASVGELVRARLGDAIAERLVDPLLAGVYAGDLDRLDAVAATPQLADAVRSERSMILGMRAARRRSSQAGSVDPFFVSIRGGIERLATRTAERAAETGRVQIRCDAPVAEVARADGRIVVIGPDGEHVVDAVVVATPASEASRLVSGLLPAAAAPLAAIPYASVAVIALVLAPGAGPLRGSGLLVPRREGCIVKAATWVTNKWPHVAEDGRTVVRASVGRRGDEAVVELEDRELIAGVREDLERIAGLDAEPIAARVTRWRGGLPQYEVGHRDLLGALGDATHDHGWIAFAGAAYRGVGISACVRQGRSAARRVLAHLSR
jgi:protoporphyrinogen/coproporphyrinogen III oxidase